MDVGLYQSAAAMNATERWQDLISDNLASASVPGARKSEISFSAVAAGLTPDGTGSYVIPVAGTSMSFQQGELQPTGSKMDFALEGPGFFSVQLANGQHAYTRNGQFRLNAQDQLVTQRGDLVLGANGPVSFDPNNTSPITVSANGDVSQGAEIKGKLQVTDFNKPQLLASAGGSYYLADDPALLPAPAADTHVRQGFIEASNTSPMKQMASLITAMRMFESNQKVMQMDGDRMSKTISDLGGTS
jgi:flagellar basal-body rod protein FlgF